MGQQQESKVNMAQLYDCWLQIKKQHKYRLYLSALLNKKAVFLIYILLMENKQGFNDLKNKTLSKKTSTVLAVTVFVAVYDAIYTELKFENSEESKWHFQCSK